MYFWAGLFTFFSHTTHNNVFHCWFFVPAIPLFLFFTEEVSGSLFLFSHRRCVSSPPPLASLQFQYWSSPCRLISFQKTLIPHSLFLFFLHYFKSREKQSGGGKMLAIARQRMLGQSFKKILPAVSVLRSYSSAAKQVPIAKSTICF
ncbi:hypothetical protein ES288_D13G141100v1 [Gossypium darwinii]|uniref:Uncharacterized protein n=1 Tax=Gossypium darwinii TaxID=34276 RepID=A0A5D2A1L8_GOSDA|nr:hypothetical protein ES288_D13G141100v1 [Gossypium darwinii]